MLRTLNTFHKRDSLYVHDQAREFAYSDGLEVERYLKEVIEQASDLSSTSVELELAIQDWPTEYHLSSKRANLLRGLDLPIDGRALEIGCGCGAITRYLGEQGLEVDAIEGSAARAEIGQLKAEFEPDRHDWVRTVRMELPVPRIIRLLGYDRLPAQQVKLNRRNLFARDRNRCQYCGHTFPTSELSIDHVVPRTQGGPDTWENLVCSCVRCNARKGGRTPTQARMQLVRDPKQPRRNPMIALRLGHEKYASWKSFLDEAYWSVELR